MVKRSPGDSGSIYDFSATQFMQETFARIVNAQMTLAESQYWIVFGLGIVLGIIELMARYRDEPLSLFGSFYTWMYMLFNGMLSALSLFLILKLGLDFTPADAQDKDQAIIYNIIMAGFGGAAFFRSSILQTKTGDKDVSVGPGLVIDIALSILDRAVDRYRAERRSTRISEIMKGITLKQTALIIAPYCVELMQNLSATERSGINTKMTEAENEILTSDEEGAVKSAILALQIANLVGFEVLQKAISDLKEIGALSPGAARTGVSLGDEFSSLSED